MFWKEGNDGWVKPADIPELAAVQKALQEFQSQHPGQPAAGYVLQAHAPQHSNSCPSTGKCVHGQHVDVVSSFKSVRRWHASVVPRALSPMAGWALSLPVLHSSSRAYIASTAHPHTSPFQHCMHVCNLSILSDTLTTHTAHTPVFPAVRTPTPTPMPRLSAQSPQTL